MKELIRTNDPVKMSYITSLLTGEGIDSVIFDAHTSVVEGYLPIVEQRLMVADEDYTQAHGLISRDDKLLRG